MSSTLYTELDLRKIKGQALKDIWHAMIGKEAGIKNTTGMKTTEDIIAAILKGQEDPQFLEPYKTHKAKPATPVVQMPPKSGETKKKTLEAKVVPQAFEAMTAPIKAECLEKCKVKRLHIGSEMVFLDATTNVVYEAIANTPGQRCGVWNPETKEILYDS